MDSPFLGMVQYFAFNFAPKGYALCNGAQLSIAQNQALFALLGTMYGGNGQTTFALPDLQGRSVTGQSSSHTIGEKYGVPSVTLLTSNMPAHTHVVPGIANPAFTNTRGGGNINLPSPNYPANPTAGNMYSATQGRSQFLGAPQVTVGNAGSATPLNTQNPYLAVTACIATMGIFPSRN